MKCKYWGGTVSGSNNRGMACEFDCPKNADSLCNVPTPSKHHIVKRNNMVRVRALGRWSNVYNGVVAVENTSDVSLLNKFPCYIVYDQKYLGGKK